VSADVEARLMAQQAKILVGKLPPQQREAMEMAFFKGLTHAEIAERTSVPLGTVKSRIRSALRSLGKAIR
jgi:RNA polymerase sigma-70 factor (ECF subfamily)